MNTKTASYQTATGRIPYGMTNDYMFRLVLEKNNYVLKGLISSLLALNPDEIASVKIQNPILLSDAIDDKEFILDIKVLLNNSAIINLEMQMAPQFNWKERSLSYLCRVFDQLMHGQRYDEVKPAIHIGFLNFNPAPKQEPEFYASYKLLNEKTHQPYSDKFIIRVVNLKQIDYATKTDCAYHIDYWARLFTATTWEEIKMLAEHNKYIASASQSLYESNTDEITREKCRAREEYFSLEQAVVQSKQEYNNAKKALDEANTQYNETKLALDETTAQYNDTKLALDETTAQYNDTKLALDETTAQYNDTKLALDETTAQYNDTKLALDETTAQLEEYKRRFGQL